ncbi:MAG: hypothetical protein ACR2L1_05500 [Pyrinomonadaceae bacterium]
MNRHEAETKREKKEPISLESDGEIDLLEIVDGELIADFEVTDKKNLKTESKKIKTEIAGRQQITKEKKPTHNSRRATLNYLILPLIFLTVTLLGGLRLSADTGAFLFLKPALVCLILSAILLVLFFRAQLIRLDGWFSETFSMLQNAANAVVLFTLFSASAQMFNALLPERGLPFWIIGLLFFWTLWNNLFSIFTAKRLVQSMGSMFGLAFVLKYLILANLTAPTSEGWLRGLIENPTKEIFTYLLDLPRFSAGTGYIQFFTVILYVIGLFLLSPDSSFDQNENSKLMIVETKD